MKIDKHIRFRLPLLAVAIGIAGLTAPLGAQTPTRPRRTFHHERDVQTTASWYSGPRWDANGLVALTTNRTNAPVVVVADRDGRKEEFLFTLEGAAEIYISDVALAETGEVAVVAGAQTATDRPGITVVARISTDRTKQAITRTWPYVPMAVTFAPDGTLWTMGHLKDEANTHEVALAVLRRYDKSGASISSTTLRVRGNDTPGLTFLRASKDRVGWFTRANQYLEFSLDGEEIGRYDGPSGTTSNDITGVAMSEAGDFLVSLATKNGTGDYTTQFLQLDRAAHTWEPVSLSETSGWSRIVGFDGATLVGNRINSQMRRFNEMK